MLRYSLSRYINVRHYRRTLKPKRLRLARSQNLRSVKLHRQYMQSRQNKMLEPVHTKKDQYNDLIVVYAQVGLCYFIANTYMNNYFNMHNNYYANSIIHDDKTKDRYFTHGLSDNDFHTKMLNNIVSAAIWPLSSIHYLMPLII